MPTVLCLTTKSDDVELLCCTALTCAVFQELELVQDHFFFPCQTCPFRWSHPARMKHNHSCLQTGVAVAARESVSQAATPAITAICGALSAQMFPLAPLKVADITGGLDDVARGFYYVKIRVRPKMANISGWMIYNVDDKTEFYWIYHFPRTNDWFHPVLCAWIVDFYYCFIGLLPPSIAINKMKKRVLIDRRVLSLTVISSIIRWFTFRWVLLHIVRISLGFMAFSQCWLGRNEFYRELIGVN